MKGAASKLDFEEAANLPDRNQVLLRDLPVELLEIPSNVDKSAHLAVIRLVGTTANQYRFLFERLWKSGIGVQLHYNPVHLQPYYRSLDFSEGQYPEAESYANTAISLLSFPGLTTNDQQYAVDTLALTLEKVSFGIYT